LLFEAKANIKKHRVGFSEAATIFKDPLGITIKENVMNEEI